MSFKSDLKRGEAVELFVLMLIRKKYPLAVKIEGKFKGYDLWIPELSKSVEVKYDPMSNRTGNLVIEVYMYGKRSGLLSSTADFWVFYDDKDLLWVDREELMKFILLSDYPMRDITGNGDNNPKKVYLINKLKLKEHINERGKI